jgi:hypothetical protein
MKQDFFNYVILKAYNGKDRLEDFRHCMAYFLNFPRGTSRQYLFHLDTSPILLTTPRALARHHRRQHGDGVQVAYPHQIVWAMGLVL